MIVVELARSLLCLDPHFQGGPENNFSKNREREITFTEIREREIRK